jgi:heat shock protein HslJ
MKRILAVTLLAAILLAACAPTSSTTLVGDWGLVSYGLPSNIQPAESGVDTLIQFKSDGTLGGNVGCNSFGGNYKVDGSKIEFSQIMATLMFCEGPVGEQEAVTLAVFGESASFTLDGDMLTITSADGNSMVVLARQ